jgi:NADPH2:quinone reductase
MRAFAIDDFGQDGTIHELPVPEPGPGEVRVRVTAAGLNPMDVFVLSGVAKAMMQYEYPVVPGLDFAGTVDATGDGVDLAHGTAVFGAAMRPTWGRGALAEYVIVSVENVTPKPAQVDDVTAASLSVAGRTAIAVVETIQPTAGQTVLLVGATGGIGGFATQLLAARGAHVIASVRPENADYARSLGAAETIDYTAGDLATAVRAAHPDGIDAVADFAHQEPELTALATRVLRRGGLAISPLRAANDELLTDEGLRAVNIAAVAVPRQAELAELFATGRLRPPATRTFHLEQAGDALSELAAGHVAGKLVVLLG